MCDDLSGPWLSRCTNTVLASNSPGLYAYIMSTWTLIQYQILLFNDCAVASLMADLAIPGVFQPYVVPAWFIHAALTSYSPGLHECIIKHYVSLIELMIHCSLVTESDLGPPFIKHCTVGQWYELSGLQKHHHVSRYTWGHDGALMGDGLPHVLQCVE